MKTDRVLAQETEALAGNLGCMHASLLWCYHESRNMADAQTTLENAVYVCINRGVSLCRRTLRKREPHERGGFLLGVGTRATVALFVARVARLWDTH